MHANPGEVTFFGRGVYFPARLHKIIGAQRLCRITDTLQRSIIKPNALRDRSFAIKTNINLGLNLHSTSGGDNNDNRNERNDTR
jgi:hypothetical protein